MLASLARVLDTYLRLSDSKAVPKRVAGRWMRSNAEDRMLAKVKGEFSDISASFFRPYEGVHSSVIDALHAVVRSRAEVENHRKSNLTRQKLF